MTHNRHNPEKTALRMGSYDGWKRLAAAVLCRAVKDWILWRSDAAARFRGLPRMERHEARLRDQRRGWWFHVAAGQDPLIFLASDSDFHRMLDVDPERLQALLADPEQAVVRLSSIVGKGE